jgi:hypothetical protein
MMSPYEGERIFEAEMVRLHQCDRTLYACTPRTRKESGARFSFRHWLEKRIADKAPQPTAIDTVAKR